MAVPLHRLQCSASFTGTYSSLGPPLPRGSSRASYSPSTPSLKPVPIPAPHSVGCSPIPRFLPAGCQ